MTSALSFLVSTYFLLWGGAVFFVFRMFMAVFIGLVVI